MAREVAIINSHVVVVSNVLVFRSRTASTSGHTDDGRLYHSIYKQIKRVTKANQSRMFDRFDVSVLKN